MKEFIIWKSYTTSYGWRVIAKNEEEARKYFINHPDEFTEDNYSEEEFIGDDCFIEVEGVE